MPTYVSSSAAADILGVSTATLYAYVSRGRIGRRTGPDGRASLFALDEVEALAARSRRPTSGPRPTIDVRITSSITSIDDDRVTIRGHDLTDLARSAHFENVAELLWSSAWHADARPWPSIVPTDRRALEPLLALDDVDPVGRLAMAAHRLDALHQDDDAAAAARRLICCAPLMLGSKRRSGPIARRLGATWHRSPAPSFVDALDTAMSVLADHELATSALAVRVAASVRASPYGAYAAGLATVQGRLHGSASQYAHEFLQRCAATSPADELAQIRDAHERVPGFGHKVYRGDDPRFAVLLDAVRKMATERNISDKLTVVDEVLREAGRTVTRRPNVDLALGALTWCADLPADAPIFAVARIAGWAAHYAEELEAPAVRYRGVSSPPVERQKPVPQ